MGAIANRPAAGLAAGSELEMAMSQTVQSPIHTMSFPGEGAEYRAARDRLLEAEAALRRQTEAVAAQRRALPPGGVVPEDYVFAEGRDGRPVRLSEMFGARPTLLVYSYMFGPAMAAPCPMCTAMLDGLDGQADHITQRAALAVVARSPIGRILDFAQARGWRHLRLISSADNSYHRDYHGEDEGGGQWPIMNVFARRPDGVIRHSYATELMFAPSDPGQNQRHIDPIWPMWNVFDLTPEGRGADTFAKLSYD
jgi:predicted dithiol-disulfide oxidoreductase (DUF899 family)